MKYNPPTGATDPDAPYVGKNPAIGQQGSKVPPPAIEHPQREIVAVIEAAGLTPDEEVLTQLRDAIQSLIASGGSPDISSARTVTSGPATSPPGSPGVNDEVLVADSPTGAFDGHARELARWNGTAWVFSGVRVGRIFRVNDTATYYKLASGGWAAHDFPATAHTHPQSDVTNLVSDLSAINAAIAGKVAKAGDVMSGTLEIGVADNANALGIRGGGVLKYALSPVPNGANYGLQIYRYGGSAGNGAQALFDHDGSTRFYGAAQIDGNLAIGTITPTAKLDVGGDTCLRGNIIGADTTSIRTFSSNPAASIIAGAYLQLFGSTQASLPKRLVLGTNSTDRLVIHDDGSFAIAGDRGTSSKVLVGNASGPPTWQLMSAIFGKKIIAIGTANSGNTITFATAEPDTSYSGVVINGVGNSSASTASTLGFGSLSSKGTGSCVVNSGNTSGSPGMTATNPVFYIIFRNA